MDEWTDGRNQLTGDGRPSSCEPTGRRSFSPEECAAQLDADLEFPLSFSDALGFLSFPALLRLSKARGARRRGEKKRVGDEATGGSQLHIKMKGSDKREHLPETPAELKEDPRGVPRE